MSGEPDSDGNRDGGSDGIGAFWAWWPDGGARLRAGIEARKLDEPLLAEITAKVQGIAPKLTWEMGPGGHRAARLLPVGGGRSGRCGG